MVAQKKLSHHKYVARRAIRQFLYVKITYPSHERQRARSNQSCCLGIEKKRIGESAGREPRRFAIVRCAFWQVRQQRPKQFITLTEREWIHFVVDDATTNGRFLNAGTRQQPFELFSGRGRKGVGGIVFDGRSGF